MGGWVTGCSGFGCQQFLHEFSESLKSKESLFEQNKQVFDDISKGYDEATEEEKNEVCENGKTRTEMTLRFTEALLEIALAKSAWGNYLTLESVIVGAYYKDSIVGLGYKTLMSSLLTTLGNATTRRVRNEYSAAMATCN